MKNNQNQPSTQRINNYNKTINNYNSNGTTLGVDNRNGIPNGIIQDPNVYGNKIENFQRQLILRRLLKEFGLGQYLRVKKHFIFNEIKEIL